MLTLMMLLLLQVNVVREMTNMSAREDRLNKDTVRHGDDEDVNVVDENNAEKHSRQSRSSMSEPAIKSVADTASEKTLDEESGKGHGKPGMEAVMGDTSDVVNVVLFNTEYEADIIDEANVVRNRVNRGAWEDRLDQVTTRYDDDEDKNNAEIQSSQSRTAMGESAIKSVVDAASKNTIDEESGKGHGKPGIKFAMVDISDMVMSNIEY